MRKEKEEKELRELRNEVEIWKFINKKRGKEKDLRNNIDIEEDRRIEDKGMEKEEYGYERKEENNEEDSEGWESEVKKEDICTVVKSLKKSKAAGVDGILNEAWLYGGCTIRESLVNFMKLIWKEGVIPKEWKTSVMMPVYKKGDQEKVENYRGISLLCSGYKIYTELLRQRLEEEIEKKNLIPDSQAGFKIVQREKEEMDSKVYKFFMNLKAAFDSVKRDVLWSILEEQGINI
ncbi:hypothetical protein DMN91_004089 [Ooceraea biroi]|uniref:Uncharacterized protein n=1 Tax=Ooceraea biroi TaxID=2015173 RepID=A0A3L8DU35_OOCBI|nr:hypothetical protein DMN91_004089 [Ooceraea biroi]